MKPDLDKELAKWDKNMEKDFCNDPGAELMRADRIIGKLRAELKQRRDSEERPATKYLSNTPFQQLRHVLSEVLEVVGEFIKYKLGFKNKLAEEITDLRISCRTFLAVLGYGESGVSLLRQQVIKKNQERVYYEHS